MKRPDCHFKGLVQIYSALCQAEIKRLIKQIILTTYSKIQNLELNYVNVNY